MATGRRIKKSVPSGDSPTSALDKMSPDELAAVLRTLLKIHPALKPEAEAVAIEMVSAPAVADIAEDVLEAVTWLGIDAIDDHAGRQPWGYVEPTEAAWELLEEAIDGVVTDMKRRLDLGLGNAAEVVCCGIVAGLHKARAAGSDGLLGWAPDFPAEAACQAVVELIRAYPAKDRRAVRNRLVGTLGNLVPDWQEMISRAADRALHGK